MKSMIRSSGCGSGRDEKPNIQSVWMFRLSGGSPILYLFVSQFEKIGAIICANLWII